MPEPGTPGASWRVRHFDGRSAESRSVEVRVGASGVTLMSEHGDLAHWPFHELVLMRGDRGGEPVQLERRAQPVEVVIVDAPEFLHALRAVMPAGTKLAGTGGFPAARMLVAIALAGAVLLFALWRFGIPALADLAAERMPAEWETQYGAAMLQDLERQEAPATSVAIRKPAELIQTALLDVEQRSRGSRPAAAESRRRFVVLKSDLPNAFAIPGGHIVLTTGLLKALRTPDELAAVYAHEWGHVRRRHVLRSILRQASLQLLLALVAGDQSALSSGLRTAGELGTLSYSREYEREADDEAMRLLASHGAPPTALGDALDSIRGAAGTGGGTLGFLSTHPAPAERLARIRAAAAHLGVHGHATWRDEAAWEAMKQALVTPE